MSRSETDFERYVDRMLVVVDDAFAAAANTHLAMVEKVKMATVWTRILADIVPEDCLQDAFDFAVRRHKSNFPINCYDIKLAYEAMVELETESRIATEKAYREKNAVLACQRYDLHFEGEFDRENYYKVQGFELVSKGSSNNDPEILLPCRYCRSIEFAVWHKR